jgi:uncharacterized repeat protein (TIGR01451 family)
MSFRKTSVRAGRGWMAILLFAAALLLFGARPVHAQTSTNCVGTYGGVIDGNVTPVPSNLQIDGACTIKNYPASNPYGGNVSLLSTTNTLLIFDNVAFTGNISCDKVHNNVVWFVNGSITRQHVLQCTNLFAPVDKIDKQNPAGQTTAAIGVPFTYTLTLPLLVSATTGGVVNAGGSNRDVSQITITDNLNATGASLSYVSSSASWKSSGAAVPFTVSNAGGLLTFSGFPTIPAGQQIVLKVTVVLNDVPANAPGTKFFNTANWTLATLVNGIFYTGLPGQMGVTPPMTIVGPNLVLTKSGPATMSVGQSSQFGLNVQNTGTSDAWNATIADRLPNGSTGGMCSQAPQVQSARVFAADGVTPVPGKGPLTAGSDFSVGYIGAPTCELSLTMLTAAGVIGPGQRLIITYRTQLDANSQTGAKLTNVAGVTRWFAADSSVASRQSFTRTLTDGTPGVLDFQDAHTITVVFSGIAITKQVSVVGGGVALAGGQLDYLVHVTNISASPATAVVITDDLSSAGPGLLTFVNPPAPTLNGSTAGITIAGSVLTADYSTTHGPLQPGQSIDLRFRVVIAAGLPNGTNLTNTAVVTWNSPQQTASASASVDVGGLPGLTPNLVLTKSGPATMSVGQWGQFGVNVQNTGTGDAWNATILDRLPSGSAGGMCSQAPQVQTAQVFAADGVTPVPGKGPLTAGADFSVSYTGAPTCQLTLTMLSAAGVIGPSQRLITTYRTQLDANSQNGAKLTNVAGAIQWYSADSSSVIRQIYTHTLTDGTPGVLDFQDAHTVTVVASGLAITKQVSVVGGGAVLAGGQLDYLVHVTNVSTNPATEVVITDDLSSAGPGRLTFVNPPAPTLNGLTAGISIVGYVLTADYSTTYGPLQPGQSIDLRFRVKIAAGLPAGTKLTNTAVVQWDNPPQTATASVSVDVGGIPGVGMLSGTAWHDANFNKIPDVNERRLVGWTVGLYSGGSLLRSVLTDANGNYTFGGLAPTDGTALRYELRFTSPGAGPNTAKLGKADSTYINGLQSITDIAVPSGSNQQNLNLPISPNGVVYDSATRAPITGAVLEMVRAGGAALPASCFDDPAQQGQVTLGSGYYRFDINFSDPTCPNGGSYIVQVTGPNFSYVAGPSKKIPPTAGASNGFLSVPTCPGTMADAVPATAQYCESQTSEFAPLASVPGGSTGTRYYLQLILDGSHVPGSNQIYNNHIPLDAPPAGAFSITKTTPLLNVSRGQLVPYTITVSNVIGVALQSVSVVDNFPAGFRYVPRSARVDGAPIEPAVDGRQLTWSGLTFGPTDHRTIVLLLAVGAGVSEGEFVNRAHVAHGITGVALSGEATATVRVVPDPTFDCTDVTGKVFDDANRNGVQDEGEKGLPGVRLVTTRGLVAITDAYGRFHITCAIVPREDRGSNFVLKLDDRTLPSGYRPSTPAELIERATRGKALRFNFGASIFRAVSLDLLDEVFEPGTTQMRLQWQPRIKLLLEELRKAPSVLRLSYLADLEDPQLVDRRLNTVKRELMDDWKAMDCCYALTVESEIFWRRGSPLKQPAEHVRASR